MKKSVILVFITATCVITLGLANISRAEDVSMAGRIGLGIQSNFLSFGLGPSVEYWATDNIGISANLGALGDFTSYGLRGNYLFNNRFDIFGMPTKPYAGAGYSFVKGPEYSFFGTTSESEGSGAEIYGGLLMQAPSIHENVYLRPEFGYSMIDVTTTIESGYGYSEEYDAGYGGFYLGFGIVYYF